jgi:hypothetical protein
MRKAGDVVFTDVDSRNSEGIVEFSNRDDMNEVREEEVYKHINVNVWSYIYIYIYIYCICSI